MYEEVKEEVNNMKNKSSSGVDGVLSKIIKHVGPFICDKLCHIFNLTFSTGSIPDELKVSLVTPIYKSGDKEDFTNYRPISVLPCFAKILEKIIYKRVIQYLEQNKILIDN